MKNIVFAIFLLSGFTSCKRVLPDRDQWIVTSPDGSIQVEVTLDSMQSPLYAVSLNNSAVIHPSLLGFALECEDQNFLQGLNLVNTSAKVINDEYIAVSGKRKMCAYHANEKIFTFENVTGNLMDIIFQVSDHGVAFRYQLYNEKVSVVNREISEFCLPQNSLVWIQGFKSPFNDYEMFYPKRLLDTMQLPAYYIPALIQTPEKKWIFISDALVDGDYAACQLSHEGSGKLAVRFPDQTFEWQDWMEKYWHKVVHAESSKIFAHRGLITPWRALIISDGLEDIVESNLIENLSEPSRIKENDWIEPGVAVFPWWGNSTANDEPDILKDYIDLAYEMSWEFIEFDIGLIANNGGYAADYWRSIDYIPEIVDYAVSKGIRVYGWDERRNLDTPEKRDDIFGKYRAWGIAGIKMDFINSDKQEAMKWYEEATEHAARYNLLVSFHGAITPRGLRRTYPNIMTFEGVRGAEYYKFADDDEIPDPVHNCTLPFTRNISGPMDYTPTSFSTPRRESTYAHELALPFVFESGWVCMADKPQEFRNCPARELLQNLHASWDEIHFIDGYPGEYCCLARSKDDEWFVAAINAEAERQIEINFDFLDDGNYMVKTYTDDGSDGLLIDNKNITRTSIELFDVTKNSGFVIHVVPLR